MSVEITVVETNDYGIISIWISGSIRLTRVLSDKHRFYLLSLPEVTCWRCNVNKIKSMHLTVANWFYSFIGIVSAFAVFNFYTWNYYFIKAVRTCWQICSFLVDLNCCFWTIHCLAWCKSQTVGLLVGWLGLTALLTQFKSYRAAKAKHWQLCHHHQTTHLSRGGEWVG